MTTTMMAQQKYRWEIDPKTNDVKRVRANEMHYQAFEDFKQVLEIGAQKANLDLSPRERARVRSRKAEIARRQRRSSRTESASDASSTPSNATPLQRTRRRRARLRTKVTNEIRRCGNTAKLMRAFPPVFHDQCNGLPGGVATLGGLFRNATTQCADLKTKIARKKNAIDDLDQQYKALKKRRTRLMFNKLAEKASRILARRNRIKEREERQEREERNRQRSRSRNGRSFNDDYITEDDVLEIMAQSEPHAHMALLINDQLEAAAPPRSTTQIEHKLRIGECINSFLQEDNFGASIAKDLILSGVKEFFRENAKKKLLGGGGDNAFDAQFGTEFEEDEFTGYTDEDIADMKPEQVTRYYAWQRWTAKQDELKIAMTIADQDAKNAMSGMPTQEQMIKEPSVDPDEILFASLLDF